MTNFNNLERIENELNSKLELLSRKVLQGGRIVP